MKATMLAAGLAATVALGTLPATATEHVRRRPPRAVLTADGERQTGKLLTHCWHYPQGDYGVGYCADYAGYDWPDAVTVRRRSHAEITFRWEGRPRDLELRAYRRVRDNHYKSPVGDGRSVDYRLSAERAGGEVAAWTARFRLPDRTGHLYLTAFARWNHRDVGGDAYYTFHLKLE